MNHIKSYSDFDKINEEVSWKSSFKGFMWGLLIAASILNSSTFFGKKFGKKSVSELIDDVKKQESQPSIQTSKIFNDLRWDVIDKIQKSNRLDNETKIKVVSSLKTIPFYVIDSEKYKCTQKTYATYIHAGFVPVAKKIIGSVDHDFIVINKKYIDSSNLSNTIVHEIYHYVDQLMGKDDGLKRPWWSEVNNIAELADPRCLSSKEYMRMKLKFLVFGNSNMPDNSSEWFDATVDHLWEQRNYYTDPTEIFVRFQNMKRWLIKEGQLKSMNDKVEEKHLNYILQKGFYNLFFEKEYDFPSLLLFMNTKWDNMNKIISKSHPEENKIS